MRNSGYERQADNWYVEPRWCVDALLNVEPFEGRCWDPACGGGTIPEAVKARGLDCIATDRTHRGYDAGIVDFFECDHAVSNIISNPPFDILQAWIERSLKLAARKVAVIGRLAFLETQVRYPFFQTAPLARVWVCSRRPSMPPGDSNIKASGGSIAYAWFVFEHGHVGDTALRWLPV